MDKLSPVYTLKNECHDCYKCVRECNVKAIKIEKGHASVISSKCIACGKCVKACPAGAKKVRNDIEKVKNLFIAKQDVYVSLAPSWVGAFDLSQSKIIGVLKKLGFKAVSETALGAQEVSIQTAKILREDKGNLYISSACPVVANYIQLYKPEYADYITKIASPALTHAKMLKEIYGEDIKVVFIGPCIAKKNESDRNQELITAALTFEELKLWINEEFIDITKIQEKEEDKFIPQSAYEGSLYPIEGGMNETIKKVAPELKVSYLNISSIESLENILNGLDVENDIKDKIFIEALGCDGGCLNGPCISKSKGVLPTTSYIIDNLKGRDQIPKEAKVVVEMEYKAKAIEKEEYPLEDILRAMKKIGKTKESDELNCGGCGYKTCRDLARALIANEAEPSMCVSYMRKIAMQKAAAMLRCMPSATVMVNSDLKIVETNKAFLKMFCPELFETLGSNPEGLAGALIDRIVGFAEVFKAALKTSQDIHKECYSYNNRLFDIIAFTIEKNELVGAIITDVTETYINREKIAHKAQEVITKNISIVQEIACLLGEHMVETELLLNSIAQGYDSDDQSEKNEK